MVKTNNHNYLFIYWRALLRRHPSAFLLAAQLVSLMLYAAVEGAPGGRVILNAFGMLILLLVVWVVIHSPAINWVAWILAALAIVLSLLSWLLVHPGLLIWATLLEAALYFYAAGGLITYMMQDDRVTIDELFAAGATFTLIAWGFTYLYLVCQAWCPGSFAGGTNPEEPRTFIELMFLSFANLSATGLSDILPSTSPARVLVMLEQFAGVAYIAVVVSRLIGLTIVRHKGEGTS
ncbi:MAG: Ion channel [Deltaproteobacteria bacterium HGW-Deltaproteobacteria-6]|nr:MAG: Ion channel [Deltaproteobacteria bacterium HGW-Deltaproteobacteria-6]